LVAAYETRVTSPPPFVTDVIGEVAPNGEAIGLRIERSAQGPLDICLRIEDIQHIVSMMLVLGCQAKRLQPPQLDRPPTTLPLPLSAINVGQDESDQTFLMLEVGAAALTFALSPAVLEEVGRMLIALSARASAKPS
jgi:hypothetical protein